MPIVRIEDPKIFIGLSVEEARKRIAEHEYDTRIIQLHVPYRPDYDPLRILLFVQNDKVVDAKIG